MGSPFTAFPELVSRLGVEPRGLVHVGAHEGQEMPFYAAAGFTPDRVILVEPIPALAAQLRLRYPAAIVHECACSDEPGEATLTLMRRTNMSTLLPPSRSDRPTGTITVEVRALADVQGAANVAVIDAQGLELKVLYGADLAALDLVVVETCTADEPTMAAPYDLVAAFMDGAGFGEAARWVRDANWVARWARGGRQRTRGEIRDVVYAREA